MFSNDVPPCSGTLRCRLAERESSAIITTMKSIRTKLPVALVLLALVAFSAPAPNGDHFQIPPTDAALPGAGPMRRAEWFQQIWTERRTPWPGRVAQEQGAVVLLGDSITQGWGEDFSRFFPGMKIANRGIGGDTTRGVLFRLQDDVLALHPAAIVLLIGTNDLEEQADLEVIVGNLKLILAAFKLHNAKMPVILCQVFPSSETKRRPADKIKKLNQLYAAAVKGNPQVIVLDTWTLFANAQGDAKPEEFPDLLHLNPAAYQKWAAALRPIFATLGFLETTPDNFTPEPGFVSLFNGRDLTGWGVRPTSQPAAPATNYDGLANSPDGRYVAINGRLVVTTPAEGRRVQQLWTTREFSKNFVLRLEFRATPNADSGVFLRHPQLQCRDYLLAGPYKQLQQYRPQQWNQIEAIVTNNVAFCTCNGEVLEAAMKLPVTGPIGLEGDRGQMEYRRIRIQELP
jgi:lysophospholipase L1-like esterase